VRRETIADLLSRDRGSHERPPLTQHATVNSGCEAFLGGELGIEPCDGVDGDTKHRGGLSRTTSTLRGTRSRIKKPTKNQRRQRYPSTCNDSRWPGHKTILSTK
jgi:hypothetical protein